MPNTELGAKGKRTRERLVVSGFSLFIKKGVAHVALEDVLQYSDVKKGAFYYYFTSKDEFLQTCFEECYLRPVAEAVDEFTARGAESLDDILYFFTHLTVRVKARMDARLGEHAVDLEDVFSNIAYMSRQNNFMAEHFVEFHDKQREFVQRCLVRMKDRGLVSAGADCAEIARMMCACREGALSIAAKDKTMDFTAVMTTYMDYFARLL
ncbi:TetR family transcriptional regulator [Actinoplanes sp. NPDC049265]|uniref:TetR family transcriptional regulator n=1 Tax=Actinoplanes sp. NPDC049265 TaxID=3363902 RepID=UPI00371BEB41